MTRSATLAYAARRSSSARESPATTISSATGLSSSSAAATRGPGSPVSVHTDSVRLPGSRPSATPATQPATDSGARAEQGKQACAQPPPAAAVGAVERLAELPCLGGRRLELRSHRLHLHPEVVRLLLVVGEAPVDRVGHLGAQPRELRRVADPREQRGVLRNALGVRLVAAGVPQVQDGRRGE